MPLKERFKLRIYGDPILRRKTEEMKEFNESLSSLVERMIKVMFENDGIGLAAPQVGISKRIAVVLKDNEPKVLINPTVVEASTDMVEEKEGCLSFPEIYEVIKRPRWVKVKAFDLDGKEYLIEGEGLLARALLHEIDHLDGKLIIDYLSPARRAIIKSKMRKLWAK
ncbi:MAG: peptide deformylase [Synergistetes bacterium]|nr:peptide deformylase [Synergistota bacterium]